MYSWSTWLFTSSICCRVKPWWTSARTQGHSWICPPSPISSLSSARPPRSASMPSTPTAPTVPPSCPRSPSLHLSRRRRYTVTSTKQIVGLLLTVVASSSIKCVINYSDLFFVPPWYFTISVYCNHKQTGRAIYSLFTFVTCNELGFILNCTLLCTYNKMNIICPISRRKSEGKTVPTNFIMINKITTDTIFLLSQYQLPSTHKHLTSFNIES